MGLFGVGRGELVSCVPNDDRDNPVPPVAAWRTPPATSTPVRHSSRASAAGECDLATEELRWTEEVYRIFELPLDARLRRRDIVDLYGEESRAAMEATRAEALRTGRRFAFDAQVRTVRGGSRWIRVDGDVVVADGQPVRLFGAKRDITARKGRVGGAASAGRAVTRSQGSPAEASSMPAIAPWWRIR